MFLGFFFFFDFTYLQHFGLGSGMHSAECHSIYNCVLSDHVIYYVIHYIVIYQPSLGC